MMTAAIRPRRAATRLLQYAVVLLAGSSILRAQSDQRVVQDTALLGRLRADSSATAARHGSEPWILRHTTLALAVTTASTVALMTLDHPTIDELSEPRVIRKDGIHDVANGLAVGGGVAPFALSAALAVAAYGHPRVESFAIHNIESIALATALVGVTKGFVGRALPDVATRHAIQFGRGFHEGNGPFVSFPSGHTAAAFAFASTIAGELAFDQVPHADLIGKLAFVGAGGVGVARVVQRVHWPSDLPLGAFIGMWSGYTVQAHAHRNSRISQNIDRIFISPERTGVRVGWSLSGGQ